MTNYIEQDVKYILDYLSIGHCYSKLYADEVGKYEPHFLLSPSLGIPQKYAGILLFKDILWTYDFVLRQQVPADLLLSLERATHRVIEYGGRRIVPSHEDYIRQYRFVSYKDLPQDTVIY
jgi:hypothetical protein